LYFPFSYLQVSYSNCNPKDYLGENFDPHTVYPKDILGLFDEDLIKLLIDKKLPILFNKGWETEVLINPDNLDQGPKLIIEEQ
jgi:hypothetical protein